MYSLCPPPFSPLPDANLDNQRVLFLGAGEAGTGIGELISYFLHKRRGVTLEVGGEWGGGRDWWLGGGERGPGGRGQGAERGAGAYTMVGGTWCLRLNTKQYIFAGCINIIIFNSLIHINKL